MTDFTAIRDYKVIIIGKVMLEEEQEEEEEDMAMEIETILMKVVVLAYTTYVMHRRLVGVVII